MINIDDIKDSIANKKVTPKEAIDNLLIIADRLEEQGKTEEMDKVLDIIDDIYYNSELSEPLRNQIAEHEEKLALGKPLFLFTIDNYDTMDTTDYISIGGAYLEINMTNYLTILSKIDEDDQESRNEVDEIINKRFSSTLDNNDLFNTVIPDVLSDNDELFRMLSTDDLLDKGES